MNSQSSKHVETLLSQVRRGSTCHLVRLMNNWPENANLPAAQAVLSLLSLERQPQAGLNAVDFDLIQNALPALLQAMKVAENNQPHTKNSMVELLAPKLEGMFSWMSLCIRGVHLFNEQLDDDEGSIDELWWLQNYGSMFMSLSRYDSHLKVEMQASATVADFMALMWTWIDPRTGLPSFTADSTQEVSQRLGCVVNVALWEYTGHSNPATKAFLARLSPGGDDVLAAKRFIDIGLARVQRLKRACDDGELGPLIVCRHINQLVFAFDQFLKLGIPALVSTFISRSCLREIMSTICSITHRLRSTDVPNASYYSPVTFLLSPIFSWAQLPDTSPFSVPRQLIEGGFVRYIVEVLAHGPFQGKRPERWDALCLCIVTWLCPCCYYPSINNMIHKAMQDTDKGLWKELMGRDVNHTGDGVHWTKGLFSMIQSATAFNFRVQAMERPRVCDSIQCSLFVPDHRLRLQVCSGCHSVVYCSKACQGVDWNYSHRHDCPKLRREYLARSTSLTWVHSSTQLHHLLVLQECYIIGLERSYLQTARQESHPHESLSNLVATFDFVKSPFVAETRPQLSTISDFLKGCRGVKSEGMMGEVGEKRLEETVRQAISDPDIRLVEGMFQLKQGVIVWVVSRLHVPSVNGVEQPNEVHAVGGFSSLVYDELSDSQG